MTTGCRAPTEDCVASKVIRPVSLFTETPANCSMPPSSEPSASRNVTGSLFRSTTGRNQVTTRALLTSWMGTCVETGQELMKDLPYVFRSTSVHRFHAPSVRGAREARSSQVPPRRLRQQATPTCPVSERADAAARLVRDVVRVSRRVCGSVRVCPRLGADDVVVCVVLGRDDVVIQVLGGGVIMVK